MRFQRPHLVAMYLGMVVAWGLNYLFVASALDDAPGLWLAFFRAGVGALGLGGVLASSRPAGALGRRAVRDALLIGIPNTGVFFGLWFLAAGSVSPGQAAVIIYTFPLWVALLSVPVLGERFGGAQALAIALGFLGVLLVAEPWVGGTNGAEPATTLELLGGAIAWAVGTVLFKRRFHGEQVPTATGYQLVGGSLTLLAAALVLEPTPAFRVDPGLLGSVLWLGLVGTTLAYLVWFALLDELPAATVSAYTFLVPVVALVASVALLGERVSATQLAGIALVLASIFGISVASRRPRHDPPIAPRANSATAGSPVPGPRGPPDGAPSPSVGPPNA
jgi:probable blue pigment (indigoidine) exporter